MEYKDKDYSELSYSELLELKSMIDEKIYQYDREESLEVYALLIKELKIYRYYYLFESLKRDLILLLKESALNFYPKEYILSIEVERKSISKSYAKEHVVDYEKYKILEKE